MACFPFTALEDDLKPLFKGAPEDAHIVATDQTVFYAQGGGQPADVGTITSANSTFKVTGVRRAPSCTIFHLGTFGNNPFKVGDLVKQEVEAETRTLHCKIHDAGHVVGLAVRRLADAIPDVTELKAQHYPGAAFVEFKGLIDGKYKADIEAAANAIVEENRPITVCWWTRSELVEKCWSVPASLQIPKDELARAVDIEGAGAYPCGGTHMRTTGEIGGIQVRKISRQKGVSKVSYALR